jgi:hypothetical protein
VGPFVVLALLLKDTDPGPNRFGPNPKEPSPVSITPQEGYIAPPLYR